MGTVRHVQWMAVRKANSLVTPRSLSRRLKVGPQCLRALTTYNPVSRAWGSLRQTWPAPPDRAYLAFIDGLKLLTEPDSPKRYRWRPVPGKCYSYYVTPSWGLPLHVEHATGFALSGAEHTRELDVMASTALLVQPSSCAL